MHCFSPYPKSCCLCAQPRSKGTLAQCREEAEPHRRSRRGQSARVPDTTVAAPSTTTSRWLFIAFGGRQDRLLRAASGTAQDLPGSGDAEGRWNIRPISVRMLARAQRWPSLQSAAAGPSSSLCSSFCTCAGDSSPVGPGRYFGSPGLGAAGSPGPVPGVRGLRRDLQRSSVIIAEASVSSAFIIVQLSGSGRARGVRGLTAVATGWLRPNVRADPPGG